MTVSWPALVVVSLLVLAAVGVSLWRVLVSLWDVLEALVARRARPVSRRRVWPGDDEEGPRAS